MKPAIDPIIALTLKNQRVVKALAAMLPNGELTYYTGSQASEETRYENLLPIWEALQPADHSLPFTYEEWWHALAKIALPCAILNDIDTDLQDWLTATAHDPTKRAEPERIFDEKKIVHDKWQAMKGQSEESEPGQITELSNGIRGIYAKLPADYRSRVCESEALEGRLREMEANIHGRFMLNAAAKAVQQAGTLNP